MSTDNAAPVEEQEGEKKERRKRDDELLALQQILWMLDDLGEEGAERVVTWIYSRHTKRREISEAFIRR